MRIDAVFSGGGVKAYAYLGVLESLEKNKFQIERVGGTSAGAIISSLVAAGFHYKEIAEIVESLQLEKFMDPPILVKYIPFSKWFYLYFQMGIYKGDALEIWLTKKLAEKGVHTFSDIKDGYLKVIASDLSSGRLVVFPDDLEKYYEISPQAFSVARAVRMSAGFPFFFMPKKIISATEGKSLIVDGGLLSNFPLWVFDKNRRHKRPVLGVKLAEKLKEEVQEEKLTNSFQMLQALFSTMKKGHDMRYVSRDKEKDVLFIPVDEIGAVDFSLTQKQKETLINSGRESTSLFLKKWPN